MVCSDEWLRSFLIIWAAVFLAFIAITIVVCWLVGGRSE